MLLFNAYIIESARHLLRKDVHSATGSHGWRDADHLVVHACQFKQNLTEYILITADVRVAFYAFSCFRVECSRSMPYCLVFFCRGISLALLGQSVKQQGTAQSLYLLQCIDYLYDVIPVDGAEISESHGLKQVPSAVLDNM